jgi:hemerythrin-like domain-containing protein
MKDEIERLKSEHWVDEDYGEEIFLALKDFVANQNPAKAETLSWMLRGFFESMRRHIAFEHAVILPVVRKKLGAENA